jgi:hypothetical protein
MSKEQERFEEEDFEEGDFEEETPVETPKAPKEDGGKAAPESLEADLLEEEIFDPESQLDYDRMVDKLLDEDIEINSGFEDNIVSLLGEKDMLDNGGNYDFSNVAEEIEDLISGIEPQQQAIVQTELQEELVNMTKSGVRGFYYALISMFGKEIKVPERIKRKTPEAFKRVLGQLEGTLNSELFGLQQNKRYQGKLKTRLEGKVERYQRWMDSALAKMEIEDARIMSLRSKAKDLIRERLVKGQELVKAPYSESIETEYHRVVKDINETKSAYRKAKKNLSSLSASVKDAHQRIQAYRKDGALAQATYDNLESSQQRAKSSIRGLKDQQKGAESKKSTMVAIQAISRTEQTASKAEMLNAPYDEAQREVLTYLVQANNARNKQEAKIESDPLVRSCESGVNASRQVYREMRKIYG